MPKYNTMLDVAFTVDHDLKDVDELVTPANLPIVLAALQQRLDALKTVPPSEACEAFGINDTIDLT